MVRDSDETGLYPIDWRPPAVSYEWASIFNECAARRLAKKLLKIGVHDCRGHFVPLSAVIFCIVDRLSFRLPSHKAASVSCKSQKSICFNLSWSVETLMNYCIFRRVIPARINCISSEKRNAPNIFAAAYILARIGDFCLSSVSICNSRSFHKIIIPYNNWTANLSYCQKQICFHYCAIINTFYLRIFKHLINDSSLAMLAIITL